MKITLDLALAIAQLTALCVGLPIGGFRIWRKLDVRLTEQDKKLAKIDYALFNDGHGMETQLKETNADVKELVKNQQTVMTDVAVLKKQVETI